MSMNARRPELGRPESAVLGPLPGFPDNPQPLPVLVLVPGQPGDPHDWLPGDRLQTVMDDFAAQHNGLAPVVVVPDVLGSQLANAIRGDSSLGRGGHLPVPGCTGDHSHPAEGGPGPPALGHRHLLRRRHRSIQMATNHPTAYPNFVDIAGQAEPALGSRQQTVNTAFGGDEETFTAIDPSTSWPGTKFPHTAGWFVVGSQDSGFDSQHQLFAAAETRRHACADWRSPGSGHDWNTAVAGIAHVLPWMRQRVNVTG
jgi:hypothetical protein